MMILKYRLVHAGFGLATLTMAMPAGSRLLTAQLQAGHICVWALVDSTREMAQRTFTIVGTGIDLTDLTPGEYVGTVQVDQMVWHVFDAGER